MVQCKYVVGILGTNAQKKPSKAKKSVAIIFFVESALINAWIFLSLAHLERIPSTMTVCSSPPGNRQSVSVWDTL